MKENGLSDIPPVTYRGTEREGGAPFFVELFTWRDEASMKRAHEMPEVLEQWEPMGQLCEERNGQPAMDFPTVERLELHG